MKKYFYFLAIAVLFAACQNKQNEELGTPFQKGQKVTLSATIANPNGGAKQMPGKQRVSGLDDTPGNQTSGAIKLTWNEGDQIKVTVNGVSSNFTLKDGVGTAEGVFEGFMPEEGTTYTVDYPVTTPNLANQKYVANGFGDELMTMHAENGDLSGFTLTAQNALLGLQLTGSKALSDIVLTNSKTGDTYTLDCKDVTLKSEATLFYIVVPAGKWEKGFKVEVLQDDKSLITDFEKTSSATFTANQAVVMDTKVADYELKTLTFEDKDSKFVKYALEYAGVEIDSWNDLIEPYYGGPLLYNSDPYGMGMEAPYWWYDQDNTELKHEFYSESGSYSYMFGGHAISNLASTDIENDNTYQQELMVYGTGAHSGTNFCMASSGFDMGGGSTMRQFIYFGDDIERVIDHMYVNISIYMYSNALGYGYGAYSPFTEDDYFIVEATGFDLNEEETGTTQLKIYEGEFIITKWTKWDLTSLGKVAKVEFGILCENDLGQPYFAYDDVAVRFPKE